MRLNFTHFNLYFFKKVYGKVKYTGYFKINESEVVVSFFFEIIQILSYILQSSYSLFVSMTSYLIPAKISHREC